MNPLKIFNAMLNVNPKIGSLLAGGLLFLASAAIVISWKIELELAIQTAGVILAFSVLAVIFANITGLIARLLAWIGFALFSSYALLIFAQFVCTSCMTPPIRPVGCLVSPMSKGCMETMVAVNEAVVPAAASTEIAAAEPNVVTRSLTKEEKPKVVFHFAGDVKPERITEISEQLSQAGWTIESNERIASAFGLNEVRTFRDGDVDLAKKLAGDLAGLWPAAEQGIAVKNLANTRFTGADKQFEIWISK